MTTKTCNVISLHNIMKDKLLFEKSEIEYMLELRIYPLDFKEEILSLMMSINSITYDINKTARTHAKKH